MTNKSCSSATMRTPGVETDARRLRFDHLAKRVSGASRRWSTARERQSVGAQARRRRLLLANVRPPAVATCASRHQRVTQAGHRRRLLSHGRPRRFAFTAPASSTGCPRSVRSGLPGRSPPSIAPSPRALRAALTPVRCIYRSSPEDARWHRRGKRRPLRRWWSAERAPIRHGRWRPVVGQALRDRRTEPRSGVRPCRDTGSSVAQ